MKINLSLLIGGLFLTITLLYMTLSLNKIKVFDNKLKFILTSLILTTYLYISYMVTYGFIRYILFLLVGTIVISRLYKISIIQAICNLFFSWLIFLISECMLAFFINNIFGNIEFLYGSFASNIIITIIAITIFSIKNVRTMIEYIVKKMNNSKNSLIFILLLVLSLSFSIILYINYFNNNVSVNFILSLIIIIIQTTITILLFNEKNNSHIIQVEYEVLANNFNEYEKMLEYQRIANHENKNQLLVIKGMIEKKDINTIEYINSIVKDHREPNENFLYETNKIPSGGLRGLIYYKCLFMKDKEINIQLNIENSVRKIDFSKIEISLNRDICKIIGVLLDNSIEAVENLTDKKIKINIKYENKTMKISISNNFSGIIDLSSVDNKGYTTKGAGHGYGLSLVKELVLKNKCIENNREIMSNVFVQNIIINNV